MRLGFIIGHNEFRKGAKAFNGLYEYDYWCNVLHELDSQTIVVDLNYGGIKQAARSLNQDSVELAIECHFNAFYGQAKGCEVLCLHDSREEAEAVGLMLSRKLDTRWRGVRVLTQGDRGYRNLTEVSYRVNKAILIEPFFGDNSTDFREGIDMLMAINEVIDFYSGE